MSCATSRAEMGVKHQVVLDTTSLARGRIGDDEAEGEADSFASGFLIEPSEIEDFIVRVRPLYGRQKIIGFAIQDRRNPGIVVGRFSSEGSAWSSHRQLLEKVRHAVIGAGG